MTELRKLMILLPTRDEEGAIEITINRIPQTELKRSQNRARKGVGKISEIGAKIDPLASKSDLREAPEGVPENVLKKA